MAYTMDNQEASNLAFLNLKQQSKKFLVIDVVDILFDNIYFSQVITELEIFFMLHMI